MVDLSRGELVARRQSLVAAAKSIEAAIAALDTALQNKPPPKQPTKQPKPMIIIGAPLQRSPRKHVEPAPERPDRVVARRRDANANEHTLQTVIERGARGTTPEHIMRIYGVSRSAARLRLMRMAQEGLIVDNGRGVYFPAPPAEVANVA